MCTLIPSLHSHGMSVSLIDWVSDRYIDALYGKCSLIAWHQCDHWRWRMDKYFHHILNDGCNYLCRESNQWTLVKGALDLGYGNGPWAGYSVVLQSANRSMWKSPNQLTPHFMASGIADEEGVSFNQIWCLNMPAGITKTKRCLMLHRIGTSS